MEKICRFCKAEKEFDKRERCMRRKYKRQNERRDTVDTGRM